MKRIMFICTVIMAFASMTLFAQETQQVNTEPVNGDFLQKAVSGGKMEVELGQVAVTKAASPTIKEFGQKMIDEHSKANEELMQIIRDNNLTLPQEEMIPEHKQIISSLSNRHGADFDRAYIGMMVKDHTEDVEAFERASKNHENEAVRTWAEKTLPVLRQHLDLAKQINKMMQMSNTQDQE